jgi:hypothetical protein
MRWTAWAASFLLLACPSTRAAGPSDLSFDRLDGTGPSGKKVDLIEWAGNLEIHVYPAGGLKGLGAVLDNKDKSRPVLVLAYRFDGNPKAKVIRRAILPANYMKSGFKAYRDPSAQGYDKIIFSNHGLSQQVVPYVLDPSPTQLYPDGHQKSRMLASTNPELQGKRNLALPSTTKKDSSKEELADESEAIRPFKW